MLFRSATIAAQTTTFGLSKARAHHRINLAHSLYPIPKPTLDLATAVMVAIPTVVLMVATRVMRSYLVEKLRPDWEWVTCMPRSNSPETTIRQSALSFWTPTARSLALAPRHLLVARTPKWWRLQLPEAAIAVRYHRRCR